MILKCISDKLDRNPNLLSNLDTVYHSIKIGSQYSVISISFQFNDSFSDHITYRIIDEDTEQFMKSYPTFILYPSDLFEVIDNSIPENWGIKDMLDNNFEMSHKAFLADGFWDKYYNDEDSEIIESVKNVVLAYKNK